MIKQYLLDRNKELIMPEPLEPQLDKSSKKKPSPKPSPTTLPNVDPHNHPYLPNKYKKISPKFIPTTLPSDTATPTDTIINHSLISLLVTIHTAEIDTPIQDPVTMHTTEIDMSKQEQNDEAGATQQL
eukprot:5150881-Ditylum_brightwellii.AAC.1